MISVEKPLLASQNMLTAHGGAMQDGPTPRRDRERLMAGEVCKQAESDLGRGPKPSRSCFASIVAPSVDNSFCLATLSAATWAMLS